MHITAIANLYNVLKAHHEQTAIYYSRFRDKKIGFAGKRLFKYLACVLV